jgi:hypothetical protein
MSQALSSLQSHFWIAQPMRLLRTQAVLYAFFNSLQTICSNMLKMRIHYLDHRAEQTGASLVRPLAAHRPKLHYYHPAVRS